MELIVNGGNRMSGEIGLRGAKNAVLPILACCVLIKDDVVIKNCPDLKDIHAMIDIIRDIGGKAEYKEGDIRVDCRDVTPNLIDRKLTSSIRSSIFILGPILSRFHCAKITYPGGCEIGARPIDLHLKGLRCLGAAVEEKDGIIDCHGKLRGGEVVLSMPSVGATENIMMAAVYAEGRTVVHNAAREPEIADLAAFINAMGGKVYGAGSDIVIIEGVRALRGGEFRPISDRIVCGTYMISCAMCGGKLTMRDINFGFVSSVINCLAVTGCRFKYRSDALSIYSEGRPNAVPHLKTGFYPHYPTDLQAPMVALLSVAKGHSDVTENLFESRFKHVKWLNKMGADITVENTTAHIRGVKKLRGAVVEAEDLRGGAALVLAGLKAEGETVIKNVHHIDRGYEKIEEELSGLGLDVTRRGDPPKTEKPL